MSNVENISSTISSNKSVFCYVYLGWILNIVIINWTDILMIVISLQCNKCLIYTKTQQTMVFVLLVDGQLLLSDHQMRLIRSFFFKTGEFYI